MKTFSNRRSIQLGVESKNFIGLPRLEVYNSVSILTEENSNFENYTDLFDEFSTTEL